MPLPSTLRAKLFPRVRLHELSTFDQVRFVTLLNIVWLSIIVILIITVVNVFSHKYDRALSAICTIFILSLPVLWLTYRHKLSVASWYLLGVSYVSQTWGLYARIKTHSDVHIELIFFILAILSIVLISYKASIFFSIFLFINYSVARLLIFYYLEQPFEIGQLVSAFVVFTIVIYFGHIVRKTALEMQEAIANKNKELSDLNRLKDKLFVLIGHDLRSPIASLKAQLMGIQEGYSSPAQLAERTAQLAHMVDSVYLTLDNLLNWAMLQRDTMRTRPVPCDLTDVARSVSLLYKTELHDKQLALEIQLDPAPVKLDEHHLHIVVRNLLNNAIKFTPRGGTISLNTTSLDGQAILTLQDSGAGMDIGTIRLPHGQFLTSRGTAGEKGTGLGLQICHELVQLNRGKLIIQSSPYKGTTVTVSFAKEPS